MSLNQACREGDINKVKELLKNGADPRDDNHWPIRSACYYDKAKIVEILLQDGRADPTVCENWAIRIASLHGFTDVLKLLLDDGRADPADKNFAIVYACRNGHTKVVELLLQDGRADPNAHSNDPIRLASARGHTDIIKLLLDDGRIEVPDSAIEDAATEEIKEMLMRYKYRADGDEYQRMMEKNEI